MVRPEAGGQRKRGPRVEPVGQAAMYYGHHPVGMFSRQSSGRPIT